MRMAAAALTLALASGCVDDATRHLAPAPPAGRHSAAFIHEPGELARMTAQAEKFCAMYGSIAELQRDAPLGNGDLLAEFTCRDLPD